METYYCHKCSTEIGYLNSGSVSHINFTGSTYKLGKFVKHTIPQTQSGLLSIFSEPSYQKYANYIVSSLASGSTEIDQFSRVNVIWYANENNGITYNNGRVQNTTNLVKVVLAHDEGKIHAYPISSQSLSSRQCKKCGTDILTG